jgi:phosphopantothenate-cysteine ligase/phosphopantothenoylcysteine decarboxylase/phosphopantothenate--cysteine ligase
MRILVTAGNTQTPIDQVRCLTNIFTGRTGTGLALTAFNRGHAVSLLTSHPGVVADLAAGHPPPPRWQVHTYRTFEELHGLMADVITSARFDAIIHAAAVSDYELSGAYALAQDTVFDAAESRWSNRNGGQPALTTASAGKLKSHHKELWLRLVPTPKLVDRIRSAWGYRGILVKFKLEVGVEEDELLRIAERSRCQSHADFMVANTLEGMSTWAYVGASREGYQRVERSELAIRVLETIEQLHGLRVTA